MARNRLDSRTSIAIVIFLRYFEFNIDRYQGNVDLLKKKFSIARIRYRTTYRTFFRIVQIILESRDIRKNILVWP